MYLQPLYLQLYTLKNRVGEAENIDSDPSKDDGCRFGSSGARTSHAEARHHVGLRRFLLHAGVPARPIGKLDEFGNIIEKF